MPKFAHDATEGYEAWVAFRADRKIVCVEISASDESDSAESQQKREEDAINPLSPDVLAEMNIGRSGEADWFVPDVLPFTHEHIELLGDWPQRCNEIRLYFTCQPSNEIILTRAQCYMSQP